MTPLSETEIYVRLKQYLTKEGWYLIGGQPPGGTDTIPIIELHDYRNSAKGSSGSKRIDLVASKRNWLLLIELKPRLSLDDARKLREIVGEGHWRSALVKAIREKGRWPTSLDAHSLMNSGASLIPALGFNETTSELPEDFVVFMASVSDIRIGFGNQVPMAVRNLLTA